ncbi:unnamed protein product [Parajaminaea phylloscopi]
MKITPANASWLLSLLAVGAASWDRVDAAPSQPRSSSPESLTFQQQQQQQQQDRDRVIDIEALNKIRSLRAPEQLSFGAAALDPKRSAVSWDRSSVKIAGKRVFLYSAEFHPWRLPVPGLWRDALNKLKEGGFNTVSIYTHWGLIAPSKSSVDVTGINDLGLFLDVAKDVGMFVNVRLGPYINAETSAGGLPGWTQNLPAALRTDDAAYTEAWQPYVTAMGKAIAPRQLALGSDGKLDPASGPVIIVQLENEYFENDKTGPYVQKVKDTLTGAGVQESAFSYNEASAEQPQPSFKSIVDLWGVDAYPQGFDCGNPTQWRPASTKYEDAQHRLNVTTPFALWEFQAGAFDPFNGASYDKCLQLTNERFARVFDLNNLAQDFKILSHYMAYGGTNFGNLAEPTVYTSYDYGAPLAEDLQIRDKLREYGLLGGFLRSSPEYPGSSSVDSGKNLGVTEQKADVLVYHRKGEGNDAVLPHWYIIRQDDSTSTAANDFKLSVDVAGKATTIPSTGSIHLDGRDARIISTNHKLPSGATLLYSTAGLSFASKVGDRDVVVLYGDAGQKLEAVLQAPATADPSAPAKVFPEKGATVDTSTKGQVRINWQTAHNSAVHVDLPWGAAGHVTVILADTAYAYTTRPLTLSGKGSLGHVLQDEDAVLVSGAYHLANATLEGGNLHLVGQSNATGPVDVFSATALTSITLNGQPVPGFKTSEYGSFQVQLGDIGADAAKYQPPALSDWKYVDSLPEVAADFDDSKWVKASLTSTPNAFFYVPGISTEGQVLFSDAYGFHSGNVVWRGHFTATGKEQGLDIRVQGGSFFGASVWVNGQHLGSVAGDDKHSDGTVSAKFPANLLQAGKDNVITVLHDSTGLEEWVGAKALGAGNGDGSQVDQPKGAQYPLDGPKSPRGILSYRFQSQDNNSTGSAVAQVKDWRVQGNYRGEACPDEVRKCLNEGGLHAEVAGWHLPGAPTGDWKAATGGDNALSVPAPGVRFFSTTVKLAVPAGHTLPMSIVFPDDGGKKATYRALLYVNGWQFGKRLAQFGPQSVFPVPPGVLDPRGDNKIDVALWSLDGASTISGGIKLRVDGRYAGDVDYAVNNPGFKQLRG